MEMRCVVEHKNASSGQGVLDNQLKKKEEEIKRGKPDRRNAFF